MNFQGIGASSMSGAMAVGGMTGLQAGAAPVQLQGVIKTREGLDVDRAFTDVMKAYNKHSYVNAGKGGLGTLRKKALGLFIAVVQEEKRDEEYDDEDEDDII